ncbi:hypothetical protein NITGR_360074 [Nitrospina gracilis 3/211]|uniref:Lcl C-terminal domain-containing protein n=1 Tax=Nitrospina gracilis (strain 3/211) TaxID=1266370 RepID=M1YZQ3_NITG3|nr:DUF1566 domain-containing protein [Nitrospina gracilis]MCF8723650.1 hypothetical protein [Nitrospina sp. Nb-3]CCQ90736.1 hypothetical protein NITGR_360074 [Nitrospina gracilis 3/211]
MSDEDMKKQIEEDEDTENLSDDFLEDLQDEDFDVDWIGEEDWDEIESEEDDEEIPLGPQFVDNGNETVSDAHNNLMWKKSDSFAEYGYGINWFEANDYIEELNEKKFAGFDDWRLCSFEEAKRMFSFTVSNSDKDGAEIHIDPLFAQGGGHNTWTYEEKPDYQQYAMIFSYVTGNEKWERKDNEYCHVRAVRDEVKEEWEPTWRKDTKKFDG